MCGYFLRLDWFDLGKEVEKTWVFSATGKKTTKLVTRSGVEMRRIRKKIREDDMEMWRGGKELRGAG